MISCENAEFPLRELNSVPAMLEGLPALECPQGWGIGALEVSRR